METQLTVRLPSELSVKIRSRAKSLGLKRSDIVRLAILHYLSGASEGEVPYERVQHLVGSVATGISDLGSHHREHMIKRLKQRASR